MVIGILLLQMILDVRIKSEDDLSKFSGIPVLGSIPQLTTGPKATGKTTRR